jgi:hypothetical protein
MVVEILPQKAEPGQSLYQQFDGNVHDCGAKPRGVLGAGKRGSDRLGRNVGFFHETPPAKEQRITRQCSNLCSVSGDVIGPQHAAGPLAAAGRSN